MGWTSYRATHYTKGKIDRLTEVKELLTEDSENGKWTPLKMLLVGSTVYAAVEHIDKNGTRIVFAAIVLTSTNSKEYFNFSYKEMDETCGPYEAKCPQSILALLSETDNEYAIAWRNKCVEYSNEKALKKTNPHALNNLPIGSKISVNTDDGTLILTKRTYGSHRPIWWDGTYRYSKGYIEARGYSVIFKNN